MFLYFHCTSGICVSPMAGATFVYKITPFLPGEQNQSKYLHELLEGSELYAEPLKSPERVRKPNMYCILM